MQQIYGLLLFLLFCSCHRQHAQSATDSPSEKQSTKQVVQHTEQHYTDENGEVQLIGVIQQENLEQMPYASWFVLGKDSYQPDAEIIAQLKPVIQDYDFEIYFGTWCSDSQHNLPEIYKILDAASYDLNRVKLVAVGSEDPLRKKTPNGDTDGKNIDYVPTVIVLKNGKEVNRIVEQSAGRSFEEDLLKITTGQPYQHFYAE